MDSERSVTDERSEWDDFMNDTFIVFDNWTGNVMGVYSEIVDAYDRMEELKTKGGQAYIESYTLNQDVDYDEDEEESVSETD